jgi:hypothetical protein
VGRLTFSFPYRAPSGKLTPIPAPAAPVSREKSMPDWWATSDALRDVLVDMGRMEPPQRKFELADIQPGWLVYDDERELIGRVDGLVDRYLVVRRKFGRFYLWVRLYVPETGLGEAHEGVVLLNVPRAWIGGMGWDRPPRLPPRPSSKPDAPAGSGPSHRQARRPNASRHRA